MKKTAIVLALTIGGALAAQLAHANTIGFTGDFAPGNWIGLLTGVPLGGGAPAGATIDPTSATVVGGDSGCDNSNSGVDGPCATSLVINIGDSHYINFHWDYTSNDVGPGFDHFGYLVDGAFTQLSDDGGPLAQSGDVSLQLADGSLFGFSVNCTDCIAGNAQVIISQFEAAPEPGSLALLGLGLAGFAAARRRRLA